ncbi:MAG: hypothetical protein ACJA2F_000715 [Nitriliruptoraceae bacterium]|jgi:hypothetical protein
MTSADVWTHTRKTALAGRDRGGYPCVAEAVNREQALRGRRALRTTPPGDSAPANLQLTIRGTARPATDLGT